MQRIPKQIRFPLAGYAADIDYRSTTLPIEEKAYATPASVNVIGDCSFSGRKRGGSRPALASVLGVTPSGTGKWLWPNGETILWPDGREMSFSEIGSSYVLPDGSRVFDHHARFNVCADRGAVPSECTAMTIYRDRLVVAKDGMWYASATGSYGDFDYGCDSAVVTRAAAGSAALAGRKGDPITALIAVDDQTLFICTARSIRLLSGEPTNGQVRIVSENIGVVSADAWCFSSGTVFFIGPNGLYAMPVGESPSLISGRLPEDMKGWTSATLVYDPEYRGVHILGGDVEWFLDIEERAFWRMQYPSAIRPVGGGHLMIFGVNKAVFMCADGRWRIWSEDATKDGGDISILSSVDIGPFRCGQRDDIDGMLDELSVTLARGSGRVSVFCHFANSAELAVDKAAGEMPDFEFTVSGGWNGNVRPRRRGAWCVLRIASTDRWAYEGILAISKPLGRLRA